MKTERGYVISEAQAQVLGQLPAPTLNAAGECVPSNFSFDNAADKTSGWQPARRNGTPNYDQFLLLWGIYHFGERAGSDKRPWCQDRQFIAKAWQSAIHSTPTGILSEADLRAFIRVVDGELKGQSQGMPPLAYGRLRWNACTPATSTAMSAIATCALRIPDEDLDPPEGAPPVDPRPRLKLDAAKLKLGTSRANLLSTLPVLCAPQDERGILCKGKPSVRDQCASHFADLEATEKRVPELDKPAPDEPTARRRLERFQIEVGMRRTYLSRLNACKRQYEDSAERHSDIQFAGEPLAEMALSFTDDVLRKIDLRPVDWHAVIRLLKMTYGEPSTVRRTQMVAEDDKAGLVPVGPSVVSGMHWRLQHNTAITVRGEWITFSCAEGC